MNSSAAPLRGVHHVRLPVSDLERSVAWYVDLLGYQKDFPFRQDGHVVGWALRHPDGGPDLVLFADGDRARAAGGFPFFAFGVPDEAALRMIEARLDERGIAHGGVQPALTQVKLPFVEDPDGHLIGFYVVGERTREAPKP